MQRWITLGSVMLLGLPVASAQTPTPAAPPTTSSPAAGPPTAPAPVPEPVAVPAPAADPAPAPDPVPQPAPPSPAPAPAPTAPPPPPSYPAVEPAAAPAASAPPFTPSEPEPIPPPPETPEDWRTGFTLELGIGLGHQVTSGSGVSESALGLAGLTLGIGGFVSPSAGVLFRLSGTNVSYDNDVSQVSGVGGPIIQLWPADEVKIEAGPGFAFAATDSPLGTARETGWGLMLGIGFAVWQGHGHSLQLALEYAPAILDSVTVHNTGLTFNWQLL